MIDKPAFCDFSFGSIVNRSPLVIGISTDGAAPVFAQAIRAKLEALIPLGFARWAAAARRWRRAVQTSGLSFPARRRFWQVFTAQAVTHPDREPLAADFDAYMALTRARQRRRRARLGHPGRRRPGRSGAADVAGGARAAIRRRDPDRRSGGARRSRFRPPRGQEDAGRQDRLRPLLQAGGDQCADDLARHARASAWCGSRAATR